MSGIAGTADTRGVSSMEDPDDVAGATELGGAGAADPITSDAAIGLDHLGGGASVGAAFPANGVDDISLLAAALDAGTVPPEQAIAQVASSVLGEDLGAARCVELRALIGELLISDPYLAGVAVRLGARGCND